MGPDDEEHMREVPLAEVAGPVVEKRPNPVTLEELARDVCLAWANGDNDGMQVALLGLFLHLYGRAPAVNISTRRAT